MIEKIKLFEMFAGIGGASFALKKANISFECIGYSEIDKDAIETYNINHPNIKNYGDCKKIIPEELPNFDLLTAGFPCQDVTIAGYQDLSKGRTLLISDVIRIANIKKPKFIFLENVKGLTSKRHKEFFNSILLSLDNIGYKTYYKLLNSKDYNTPQNRERVYFVCIRKDLNLNFKFPELEKYINDWHNYIDDPKRFKKLNKTKTNDYLVKWSKNITNQKYSMCIIKTRGKFIREGLVEFDDYYRLLTARECFRLQGFFDDEINIENISDRKACALAGNSWDINIVSKILKVIPFNGEYIKTRSLFDW